VSRRQCLLLRDTVHFVKVFRVSLEDGGTGVGGPICVMSIDGVEMRGRFRDAFGRHRSSDVGFA
jgi:hypothetical protein